MLTPGTHTLTFYLREAQARADWIEFVLQTAVFANEISFEKVVASPVISYNGNHSPNARRWLLYLVIESKHLFMQSLEQIIAENTRKIEKNCKIPKFNKLHHHFRAVKNEYEKMLSIQTSNYPGFVDCRADQRDIFPAS